MFLETIGFENGEAPLLEYHRRRVIKTLNTEKSKKDISHDEKNMIDAAVSIIIFFLSTLSPPSSQGRFKCRMLYNPYKIDDRSIEFIPYQQKPIHSLKLVDGGDIVYDRKYSDRSEIDKLYSKKGEADDILIVRKGMVTDTSYCNIIFFNGKEWITPVPLLPGVRRAYLISLKVIREAPIRVVDLPRFKSFKLVNSMRDFERAEIISIENIS